MIDKLKKLAPAIVKYAKIAWEVPAVKSKIATWIIRAAVPGGAILYPVIDAIIKAS